MVSIFAIFEIIATFVESFCCYLFNDLFVGQEMQKKKCVILSAILTIIISSLNYSKLFSLITLLFALLFVSLSNHILFKVPLFDTFSITAFFSFCLIFFDFFSMTIIGFSLGNNSFASEVVTAQSIYRCFFLILSKSLLVLGYLAVRKLLFFLKKMKSRNLLFITVLGYIGVCYYAKSTFEYINIDSIVNWFLLFTIVILFLFSLVVYISFQKEVEQKKFIEERNTAIANSYTDLAKTYRGNAQLYHDMKNHILIIQNLFENKKYTEMEKYLNSLSEVSLALDRTWTGNDVIDCILNIKKTICEQKNIKIVIDVDPIGNELDKFIISTIMSNLLDNAIEACQKIKNEVPYIRVAIRHINDMIFVKIQNPVYDLPDLKRGILLTTKHNNQQHGWGVKSVESAVKRADGVFRYSCSGGEFVSMVTLFL